MAERTVIWSQTASLQLREILKFWIEHNKSSSFSLKLLDKIEKNTLLIKNNPLAYPESTYASNRIYPMGHYSIFYRFDERHIIITAFWDNRQDPKKLLEVLKKSGNS